MYLYIPDSASEPCFTGFRGVLRDANMVEVLIQCMEWNSTRTIIFSKIARIFSIHIFSIFARNFSIPGFPYRSGLFPALLQYRAAWSAHMNLKIKLCS
jgi:hypothetical protein